MRPRAAIAAALCAVAGVTTLAGCGPEHQPVASTPAVTVPTPTGPALTSTALQQKAGAACTTLFAALDRLGKPPTDDIPAAKRWYPAAARAWHAFLDDAAMLVPPPDMVKDWGAVVDNARAITEDADRNVALINSGRQAIEVINSDPTADQGQRNLSNGELMQRLGIAACLKG